METTCEKIVSGEESIERKPVEWDVNMEIQLFYAMANHKPVGINKHFHMACIWEKLSSSITKQITTKDIWDHLDTLYDMSMLEGTEPIPFPNEEVPFSLDESEFGELMRRKREEVNRGKDNDVASEVEDGGNLSPKIPTPKSGSSKATTSKDSTPQGRQPPFVIATPLPAAVIRKDSGSAGSTKARKESGSSHASTDTPSVKSDYERRRDSRDSNASGTKDGSVRKPISQRDKAKNKASSAVSTESSAVDEDSGRRGRRRAHTSTPHVIPAKRRRT